ncbi:MAG: Bug family tripartite tricarboxylate transporter substrate binding protein [Beijerinckiaceae bacterium]
MTLRRAFALLAAGIFAAYGSSANAQEEPAKFYAGRNVTIVVGSTTGGGYDFNARAVGRHIGKHIPGAPAIVVQNMPGAGSIVATNYVYNVAPQDGSVIGAVQRPIPFEPFFEEKGVRFDVRKIHWLGSTTSEVGVVVAWHTAPQRTFKDVLEREMIVGGNGPATDTELFARALNRELGAKFRIVAGYPGESQIILAMERGEIQGVANWSWNNIPAKHPDWLRDGKIRLLMQLGLRKHPALPDVPLILDFAKDADQRKLFETMMQMKELGRPYFVAPGVPADRVETLRSAFMKTMNDSEFVNEMKKAGISIDPVSGAEMQKTLAEAYALPQALIQRTRAALAH